MRYDIEKIKETVSKEPDTGIVYFWGHTPNPNKITAACLSQWYDCHFTVDGVAYHTTEQYMMASKARLFGDEDTCRKIMEAETPHDYKALGREISGFDQAVWDKMKLDIVVNGNKAKFSQCHDICTFLLSTGNAILAEASPYDRVWGIGLDRETAESRGVEHWRGENLLGCALMEVRDWLRDSSITPDGDGQGL